MHKKSGMGSHTAFLLNKWKDFLEILQKGVDKRR